MDVTDSAQSEEAHFDRRALEKLAAVGGDRLVLRMIDLFTEIVPQRLQGAREALDSGDFTTLERITHSLKSSAANVGLAVMRATAAEIERRAAGPIETSQIQPLLVELQSEYDAILPMLLAERRQRGG